MPCLNAVVKITTKIKQQRNIKSTRKKKKERKNE